MLTKEATVPNSRSEPADLTADFLRRAKVSDLVEILAQRDALYVELLKVAQYCDRMGLNTSGHWYGMPVLYKRFRPVLEKCHANDPRYDIVLALPKEGEA